MRHEEKENPEVEGCDQEPQREVLYLGLRMKSSWPSLNTAEAEQVERLRSEILEEESSDSDDGVERLEMDVDYSGSSSDCSLSEAVQATSGEKKRQSLRLSVSDQVSPISSAASDPSPEQGGQHPLSDRVRPSISGAYGRLSQVCRAIFPGTEQEDARSPMSSKQRSSPAKSCTDSSDREICEDLSSDEVDLDMEYFADSDTSVIKEPKLTPENARLSFRRISSRESSTSLQSMETEGREGNPSSFSEFSPISFIEGDWGSDGGGSGGLVPSLKSSAEDSDASPQEINPEEFIPQQPEPLDLSCKPSDSGGTVLAEPFTVPQVKNPAGLLDEEQTRTLPVLDSKKVFQEKAGEPPAIDPDALSSRVTVRSDSVGVLIRELEASGMSERSRDQVENYSLASEYELRNFPDGLERWESQTKSEKLSEPPRDSSKDVHFYSMDVPQASQNQATSSTPSSSGSSPSQQSTSRAQATLVSEWEPWMVSRSFFVDTMQQHVLRTYLELRDPGTFVSNDFARQFRTVLQESNAPRGPELTGYHDAISPELVRGFPSSESQIPASSPLDSLHDFVLRPESEITNQSINSRGDTLEHQEITRERCRPIIPQKSIENPGLRSSMSQSRVVADPNFLPLPPTWAASADQTRFHMPDAGAVADPNESREPSATQYCFKRICSERG